VPRYSQRRNPNPVIINASDEHKAANFNIHSGEETTEALGKLRQHCNDEDNFNNVKFILLHASETSSTLDMISICKRKNYIQRLNQKKIDAKIQADAIMVIGFGYN
jgi:hypothetical protein